MNLGDMMLSEMNQTQKDRSGMISLICGSEIVKNHRNREWDGGCQSVEGGETGR